MNTRTRIACFHLAIAFLVFAASMDAGATNQRCIYLFDPVESENSCQLPGGCAPNGCPAQGDHTYGVTFTRFGCDDGLYQTSVCLGEQTAIGWLGQNRPTLLETCDNPWSATFYDCDDSPAPNQCRVPVNHKASNLGDPVDVTSGLLERTDVDVDLGRGLEFARQYSSDSTRAVDGSMGKGWRHSFDWRIQYATAPTPDPPDPTAELVIVTRPFSRRIPFKRLTYPQPPGTPGPWTAAVGGGGGLTGDDETGFTFTDDDGTRVTFHLRRRRLPPLGHGTQCRHTDRASDLDLLVSERCFGRLHEHAPDEREPLGQWKHAGRARRVAVLHERAGPID